MPRRQNLQHRPAIRSKEVIIRPLSRLGRLLTAPTFVCVTVDDLLNPCECGQTGCCGCYMTSGNLVRTRRHPSPEPSEHLGRSLSPTGVILDTDTASQRSSSVSRSFRAMSEPETRSCCMPASSSSASGYPSGLTSSLESDATHAGSYFRDSQYTRSSEQPNPGYSPKQVADFANLRLIPLPSLDSHSIHRTPTTSVVIEEDNILCGPNCTCDGCPRHPGNPITGSPGVLPCCVDRSDGNTTCDIKDFISTLAAAIPRPPENSRESFDPNDVSVYSRAVRVNPEAARMVGLVTVPPFSMLWREMSMLIGPLCVWRGLRWKLWELV